MATEKSSEEDAKTLDDSKNSAQNGAKATPPKPNGSKPSVGEIRKRAYEIFQARQGGSEIGDWQKAEASVSADATKDMMRPRPTRPRLTPPRQMRLRRMGPSPKRPRWMRQGRCVQRCEDTN